MADLSFVKLNPVIREAGAELISARALSFGNEGREIVADGLAAKLPEMTSTEFLEVALLGQLDYVIGNQRLETTILTGRDVFTPALISKYGEKKAVYLLETLNDIERLYQRDEQSSILCEKIADFQNNLLCFEFDNKLENVNSLEDGQEFLEELLNFREGRIKVREELDKIYYTDRDFEAYFKKCKHTIERKYGQIDIGYDEEEWAKKYKFKQMIPEISEEEIEDILKLSIEFTKIHKKKGVLAKFFNKARKNNEVKTLSEGSSYSEGCEFTDTLKKYIIDERVEYSKIFDRQENRTNQIEK